MTKGCFIWEYQELETELGAFFSFLYDFIYLRKREGTIEK